MRSFSIKVEHFFKMDAKDNAGNDYFDEERRQLIIPLYQREYKWEMDKVETLIKDIISRDKFLGIVILDAVENGYEIVDGQQRITTLFIALICLFNLYENSPMEQNVIKEYIYLDSKTILANESIGDNYINDKGNCIEIDIRDEDDVYFQKDTFLNAYENIKRILNDFENGSSDRLKEFRKKMLDCEVVIICNDEKVQTHPIEQIFLDINEKSQLLDVENIFKSYCFKNYDGTQVEELKNNWIKLKKCGAEFTRIHFKDLSQYLYLYLLINGNVKLSENLYDNGKHFLEGKTIDETKKTLDSMIKYGEANIELFNNIDKEEYRFCDLCEDSKKYENTRDHIALKRMFKDMFFHTTNYHKLPVLFFIDYLKSNNQLKSQIGHSEFKKILTNLYISGMLFVHSQGRKGKLDLDYSFRDELLKENFDLNNLIKTVIDLRKVRIGEFEISFRKCNKDYLIFIFSIMDMYISNENFLSDIYVCDGVENNLEHFIIPDNKKGVINWIFDNHTKPYVKKVEKDLKIKGKKYFGNYLILNYDLNGKISNNDIVSKVKCIKKWYSDRNETIPIHINCYIEILENMEEYRSLVELKESGENNIDVIEESYNNFLNKYFSDDTQHEIVSVIKEKFVESFYNG